jgi:hypothetical protein
MPDFVKYLLTSIVDLVAGDALATRAFWDRRLSLRWDGDAWIGEVSVLIEADRAAEINWPVPAEAT